MSLWTAAEAAEATGGIAAGDWAAEGVSIDTRTIAEGDLFVALKDVRDGHDFVAQALEKGAAAALVSRVPEGVDAARCLVVPDVLEGLAALGRAGRARSTAKVVGVTGSVGKTSTKEMLKAALSGQGKTHVAEASYNNHWGVPLTLARMPQDADYAVIEIGMNHPGEIAPLSVMARPHVVLVMTVAAAHLEAFESLDGIAEEKASIVSGLEPGGVAVMNMGIETSPILARAARDRGARLVGFSEDGPDWTLRNVRLTDSSTVVEAMAADETYLVRLSVPGRHFAMNAVAVLAVCEALGADPVLAAQDIGAWVPPHGRGTREIVQLDVGSEAEAVDLIDDAFNANPTSMTAALEVLAASTPRDGVGRIVKGRRVAILGDMLELGPDEMEMHEALAHDAHLSRVDLVHCVGHRMQRLFHRLPDSQRGHWAETAEALAARVTQLIDAGDVVLVKGSKGSKVSLIVDAIRKLGHR